VGKTRDEVVFGTIAPKMREDVKTLTYTRDPLHVGTALHVAQDDDVVKYGPRVIATKEMMV